MQRTSALFALAAAAVMTGCASSPTPTLIERDPVDGLIAKNAANATQALRELSEASGESRVVTVGASSSRVAPIMPPATSIASRRASIAVEGDPSAQSYGSVIAGPSGVVASGGLLSAPPPGLQRLVTVRWTGELEQLLSRIATECGWKLGESTGLRVAPVIVSINAENRSAFDVLQDIGAISGASADILVSAPTKTISVRYPQR